MEKKCWHISNSTVYVLSIDVNEKSTADLVDGNQQKNLSQWKNPTTDAFE